MSIKKAHEEFIRELKLKQPKLYNELEILGEYKGAKVKILVSDKYGKTLPYPSSLMKGISPTIDVAVDKNDYFIKMLKEKQPKLFEEIELLESYIGANNEIKAFYKYGEVRIKPDNLINGYRPTIIRATNKTLYFIELLKEKQPKLFSELEILGEYKKTKTKILVGDKYGKTLSTPNHLLNGIFPTIQTAINKNLYFKNMAKEIHGNKYDYSNFEYKNNRFKSTIICKKCDFSFEINANSHLLGQGCPKCKFSKGELKVCNILDKLNINYIPQYKFEDCKNTYPLPFDVYIPNYNTCIEYDGEQHYESVEYFGGEDAFIYRKINDNIKTNYCKDNDIKLIRIPYWDFDNIEIILKEKLKED